LCRVVIGRLRGGRLCRHRRSRTAGRVGSSLIQGTFRVIQGTFRVIQGTFRVIQGTFRVIEGTFGEHAA
jgi:hypothetical protein